jgi:hypothetical protein
MSELIIRQPAKSGGAIRIGFNKKKEELTFKIISAVKTSTNTEVEEYEAVIA